MQKENRERTFAEVYNLVKEAAKKVCHARSYFIKPMIVSYLEDYTPLVVMGTHNFAITHRAYISAAIYMLDKEGVIYFDKTIQGYCLWEG